MRTLSNPRSRFFKKGEIVSFLLIASLVTVAAGFLLGLKGNSNNTVKSNAQIANGVFPPQTPETYDHSYPTPSYAPIEDVERFGKPVYTIVGSVVDANSRPKPCTSQFILQSDPYVWVQITDDFGHVWPETGAPYYVGHFSSPTRNVNLFWGDEVGGNRMLVLINNSGTKAYYYNRPDWMGTSTVHVKYLYQMAQTGQDPDKRYYFKTQDVGACRVGISATPVPTTPLVPSATPIPTNPPQVACPYQAQVRIVADDGSVIPGLHGFNENPTETYSVRWDHYDVNGVKITDNRQYSGDIGKDFNYENANKASGEWHYSVADLHHFKYGDIDAAASNVPSSLLAERNMEGANAQMVLNYDANAHQYMYVECHDYGTQKSCAQPPDGSTAQNNFVKTNFVCGGNVIYTYHLKQVAPQACTYYGEGDVKIGNQLYSTRSDVATLSNMGIGNTSFVHLYQNGATAQQGTRQLPYFWSTYANDIDGSKKADGTLEKVLSLANGTYSLNLKDGTAPVTLTSFGDTTQYTYVGWDCDDKNDKGVSTGACPAPSGTGPTINTKLVCGGVLRYVYKFTPVSTPQACTYDASGAVRLNGVELTDNSLGLSTTDWVHYNAAGSKVAYNSKVIAPKYSWTTATGAESNGSLRSIKCFAGNNCTGQTYDVSGGHVTVNLRALPAGYRLSGWTCTGVSCKQTQSTQVNPSSLIDMNFDCGGHADYVYDVVSAPAQSCTYKATASITNRRAATTGNTYWEHYDKNGNKVAANTKTIPYSWSTANLIETTDNSLHTIRCLGNNCAPLGANPPSTYDIAGGRVPVKLLNIPANYGVSWTCTSKLGSCDAATGNTDTVPMHFICNDEVNYAYSLYEDKKPQACRYNASGAVQLNGMEMTANSPPIANTSWAHISSQGVTLAYATKVIAPKYSWTTDNAGKDKESNGSLKSINCFAGNHCGTAGTTYDVSGGHATVALQLPSGYELTGWTCVGNACKQASGTTPLIDMNFNCGGQADYVYKVSRLIGAAGIQSLQQMDATGKNDGILSILDWPFVRNAWMSGKFTTTQVSLFLSNIGKAINGLR